MNTSFSTIWAGKNGRFFAFFWRFFFERPRLNAGIPAFKCNACLTADKKILVNQHVNGLKHTKLTEKKNQSSSSTVVQMIPYLKASGRKSQFSLKLCDEFLTPNIPLRKLDNQKLSKFLEKSCPQSGLAPSLQVNHPVPNTTQQTSSANTETKHDRPNSAVFDTAISPIQGFHGDAIDAGITPPIQSIAAAEPRPRDSIIFVSRVRPDVSTQAIFDHARTICPEISSVKRLKVDHPDSYASFIIVAPYGSNDDLLVSSKSWIKGILVKRLPRHPQASNVIEIIPMAERIESS